MRVSPLPGIPHRRTLGNGLRVLVLENRQAPIVTTALTYRVGARDDPPGGAGLAHFLEHMMFKGSARYAPGEIDAVTQRLGGDSNALTWHDATAYYFEFASDRWPEALAIEVDRMHALRLDPAEVERERSVILEEIATAVDDPWQVLEDAVHATFFGAHPYGRPILGTAAELGALGNESLRARHRRHYGPEGAVLVVAGDVGADALDRVERVFGEVGRRSAPPSTIAPRRPVPGRRELETERELLPRWLAVLPCPHPEAVDYASVRMAAAVLGLGRMSRLQRELVDEAGLLAAVGCTVFDTLDAGCVTLSAEPSPGVTLEEVENRIWRTIAALREDPPADAELERIRHLLVSDWVFAHETIGEQAITASFCEAWLDLDFPRRQLEAMLAVSAAEISEAVRVWLDPERESVVGRCVPLEST